MRNGDEMWSWQQESAEMEVDLGDSSEADASDEDDEVTVQPKKQRTGGSRQPTK